MSKVRKHISEVSEAMTLMDEEEIQRVVTAIRLVKAAGGTVYLFGNGGSHSTAGHFANDLMKMSRVKAVCLGDMGASMLAYGNDNGWVNMFRDPLAEMMKVGDGVIGISCSGKSENVIAALGYAVSQEVIAIGFTGDSLSSEINYLGLDCVIHARYPDIRVQEDFHSIFCHAIARELQE